MQLKLVGAGGKRLIGHGRKASAYKHLLNDTELSHHC